ncbi:MAG: ATP-dependent zinc metalloprotease FtsH [Actinobacteria bacterium]|nr:MAG: ATP-dependent zinc metalloprotease FtsH [Actinomycetota bacterium]
MPDNDKNNGRRSGPDGPSGPGIPRTRLTPWILIALVVLGLVAFNQWFSTASRQSIDLSRFYDLVDQGKITGKVTISATQVSGTYTDADGTSKSFVATLPGSNYDPSTTLEPKLQAKGIDYTGTQPSPWFSLLASILPLVLLMGIAYYFLFRRVGGGAANPLNMGKNKVKIYDRKEMKTTFSDVAGVDEAKEELKEIVEFLKNPKKYQRLGGRIPKGVLLLGPPGCGKTLLARAVAGEANVPFFFMSGSEFVEMFVGLGAARVRELFQQAKEKAPALVFLDEIDTIGKGRSGVMGAGFGAHDEREQTLNQLLVEMDGFDSSKGVIIMAATNRPDVLDPALVRPGRFDRQVVVDPPDLRGREEILRVHARGVALDPAVELRMIAARTPGFTGADLENVVNEAALLAARREKNSVTMEELEEAIDRASMGLERKSRVISDREKVRVAAHEMGHALVAHFCENLDPVHRVTIVARGTAALGLTMTRPLEDRYMATEPELKDMLAFAMGGRVAEEIVFGEVSTGAQNDLEKATQIARAMVAEYGMSDKVGPLSLGRDDPNAFWQQPKISGETAQLIDQETRRLLDEAHDKAERILKDRRQLLDELRDLLLVVETIDGDDIEAYATGTKRVPDPETARREQDERAAAAAAVALRPATAAHTRRAPRPVIPPAPPLPAD